MARKPVTKPTAQAKAQLGVPMDDEALLGVISQHIDEAINRPDGDVTRVRADLYKRYLGELYGTERAGYSHYTTREIFEAIEWALPQILEVFTGHDRAVMFEPNGEDDRATAEQETDVVNHRIDRANEGNGFMAIYSFCKDALMYPTAYAKAYVEKEKRETVHKQQGLIDVDLQEMLEDKSIELVSQDSRMLDIPVPDMQTGETMMQSIEVFDIEYRKTTEEPMLRIECTPGEEVLVDHRCTTLDLDQADFICHRTLRTHTELIEAGYDLSDIPGSSSAADDESSEVEKYTRYFYEDEDDQAHDTPSTMDPTLFRYVCNECWLWADVEGRETAQFWHVMVINGVLAEKERTDYQPFVAMSSIIQTHKHIGMSMAQSVENLQVLQTELVRQMLDNIRVINTRRKVISADSLLPDGKTMDAMLDTTAEWIPVDGQAREAMMPEPHTSIVQELLPVITNFDQKTMLRTGVSVEKDLDPSSLQNTSVSNYMAAIDKAGGRLGMIIKCFAETGVKQLYTKVHKLSRMYLNVKETVELRGRWVDIDPNEWQDRRRMKVTVGLGHNTRQQRVQLITNLLQHQIPAMEMNLVDFPNLYNTMVKLVEASGLGAADQYFVNPGSVGWQPPQPPPDPAMILAQSRAMLEQTQAGTMQQEQQRKGMETQAKIQEMMQSLSQQERELVSELQQNLAQINEIRAQTETEELEADLIVAQVIETLAKAEKLKAEAKMARNPPAQGVNGNAVSRSA